MDGADAYPIPIWFFKHVSYTLSFGCNPVLGYFIPISMVEKRYGEKVFQTKIRENISIAEMPLSGQTIFEYEPKSNGAADYQALVDEIISREENR